jgi:hypothetical protein
VYEAASSPVLAQSVVAPEVSVGLVASPRSPAPQGVDVVVTATVDPAAVAESAPTGVVQFVVDGVGVAGVARLAGGVASTTLRGLAAGTHTIKARYTGDAHFDAAESGVLRYVVSAPRPEVGVTLVVQPSGVVVQGDPVRATASVEPVGAGAGSAVGGSVLFLVDGVAWGGAVELAMGSGSAELSGLAPGAHRVEARYLGDGVHPAWSSAAVAVEVVARGGPQVGVGLATWPVGGAVEGQPVALVASVAAVTPGAVPVGGLVHFLVDGVAWGGAVPVTSGAASVVLGALPVGAHTFEARYLGDGHHLAGGSGALVYPVAAVAPVVFPGPPVVLSVLKEPAKATGKVLIHVIATALADGYSVAGRVVEVRVNGGSAVFLRTDSKGSASLALVERRLQVGKNPVLVRFHSGSESHPVVVSRSVVVTVSRVRAASVKVKAGVEGWGREVALTVRAKAKVAGYSVAGRSVKLLAGGKVVARARTDAKGRATLVVGARDLATSGTGARRLVVRFEPGSDRYRPTLSTTYRAEVRGGLIREVRTEK